MKKAVAVSAMDRPSPQLGVRRAEGTAPVVGKDGPRRGAMLTKVERYLDVVVLVAALAVVPVIIVEQSHAGPTAKSVAEVANWVIWILFAAQATLMLAFSADRRGWAQHHKLELAVVIFTPPVLPAGLQLLRVLRLLRLLRLVVAVKLARRLFTLDGVKYAAILTAAVIVAGGYAYANAENTTTGMGMWWALVTATTVGYGDVSPHTEIGRAIGAAVMIIGTGFVALLTAAAAQRFLSTEIRHDVNAAVADVELTEVEIVAELRRVHEQLDRLSAAVERRATVTPQDRAA
jgi:voltage-gated potassium channel